MKVRPWMWGVWLFGAAACPGCTKPPSTEHGAPSVQSSSPTPSPVLPHGAYRLTPEKLDAYLRYQGQRVSLLRAAGRLKAPPPPEKTPEARRARMKGLAEQAAADDLARVKTGLSEEEVTQTDALVLAVVSARERAASLNAEGAIEAWKRMREKIPPNQRVDLDRSVGQLEREREEGLACKQARERFGNESVDVVLGREKEVAASYNAWLRALK